MAILEGRWDCASCGRVGNMGHDLHCAGCGRPRGTVKFYLPPNAEEVVEQERLAEAKAGPDWICGFCEASNRSTSAHCTGCGAARADGTSRVEGGGDARELTDEQREQLERAAVEARRAKEAAVVAAARARRRFALGCSALLVLLVLGGTALAFVFRVGGASGHGGPLVRMGAPRAGAWVSVVSRTASRRIDIQSQREVEGSGWCSSMPADAHTLSRERRQDGTRCEWIPASRRAPLPLAAVGGAFGTKDLGNGYFETTPDHHASGSGGSGSSGQSSCRNIPVYRDWCRWEALRWVTVRSPMQTSDTAIPDWPAVTLAPGEREGARVESFDYDVRTSDGELIHFHAPSAATWTALVPTHRYGARFSFFGGLENVGAEIP